MELIEQFVQKEGIELTEEQKIGALANYQELIVTDIDNMTNEQILKVFVTRKDKKRESTRIRTVAECGICGNIRSSEKKKFGDHIRMHIRKDRSKVLDYLSLYNDRQVRVAIEMTISPMEDHQLILEDQKIIVPPTLDLSIKHSQMDAFVMWAVNNNPDSSSINSPNLRDFLKSVSPQLASITPARLTRDWLPETADRMMNFIYSHFWKCKTRLLIEHGKRQHSSFFNFYLASDVDTTKNFQTVFPETFLIKRVTVQEGTIVDIAGLIADTLVELAHKSIEVTSYSIDNCTLNKHCNQEVETRINHPIRSVTSGAHVLTGVLREVMHCDPTIRQLWKQVRTINQLIQSNTLFMEMALKHRDTYPYQEIQWQDEWNWSYLKETVPAEYLQYQDPTLLEHMINIKETVSLNTSVFNDDNICAKLTELGKSSFLLQYKKNRWYSAWVVMKRVYALYPALKAMQEELSETWEDKDQDGNHLIRLIDELDQTVLQKVLNYLLPIVQGIVYCQNENTAMVDVISILTSLREYYSSCTFFPLDETVRKECIDDRLNCVVDVPESIIEFFYGTADKTPITPELPSYENLIREVHMAIKDYVFSNRCGRFFSSRKQEELFGMMEVVHNEIVHYLEAGKERECMTVRNYLEVSTWKYPVLWEVYRDLFCDVTSSSNVERSMIMHGVASIPRQTHMDEMVMNTLILLKTNHQFIQEYNLQNELHFGFDDHFGRKRFFPTGGHPEYLQL